MLNLPNCPSAPNNLKHYYGLPGCTVASRTRPRGAVPLHTGIGFLKATPGIKRANGSSMQYIAFHAKIVKRVQS